MLLVMCWEGEASTKVPALHEVPDLAVQTNPTSVFNQVSSATMAKANMYVRGKPKGCVILKIRCKAEQKYLLQFD